MGAVTGTAAPWPAPAKLNLFLHIVGRRPDGYHELQTAFQFIDLCDELEFEPRADGEIVRLEGPADVQAADDLVVRAALRLREAAGAKEGAGIRLRKRIPMQGGLGGGSSDAATTLVALNALWNIGMSVDELARLGLELGADVPVFVRGQAAWAEGVGERLTPIELPELDYLVIRPPAAVSTAEIFQAPELTRNSAPLTIRALLEGDLFRAELHNDCEPVVRARYPSVAAALDWLSQYGPARMTGTGSCVFAAIGNKQRADQALAALPPDWQGFFVKGCNRSPLQDRWGVAKR